jgi:phosphoglycolate phosphatase
VSRYRLAIFSLDGTLVDTLGDITDALNFTMRAMGMPELAQDEVAQAVPGGVAELLERAIGPEGAQEAAALFRSTYLENLCERSRPYPGIPELLETTRLKKAVATNKPGGLARRILAEFGLAGHFVQVLGDDDVERKKPDPLVVQTLRIACEARPGETVLVGDSLIDARTARAAGVAFCAVSWGYTSRVALIDERPTYLVDSLAELHTVLG